MSQPLHTLYTERLTLTLFNPNSNEDLDNLIAVFNDPVALEKQGDVGIGTREDMLGLTHACHMDNSKFTHHSPPLNVEGEPEKSLPAYMIRLGTNAPQGKVIGDVSLVQRGAHATPDMGWIIFHQYAGNGYATEAAREALRY